MSVTPGQLVRQVRQRHHLSQRELADRAGTAQSAISRIERDQLSPTIETLASLLRVMGEDLDLASHENDFGHDRTLLRSALRETPSRRLRRGVGFANFVLRNRGAATRRSS